MNQLQKLCVSLLMCTTLMVQARTPCKLPSRQPVYQTCCPQPCFPPPCAPQNKCDKNLGLYALGILLLGTAAGVGVGYAAGNNNHHSHSPGNDCCPPPESKEECCADNCGCKNLKNSKLCFDFTFSATLTFAEDAAHSGHATLTFYAITPNGCTNEGEPIPITISKGDIGETFGTALTPATADLKIAADGCGTYQIGAILSSPFPMTATMEYSITVKTNCHRKNLAGIGMPTTGQAASINFIFASLSGYSNTGAPVQEINFQLGQYVLSPKCCILEGCSCSSSSSSCDCDCD